MLVYKNQKNKGKKQKLRREKLKNEVPSLKFLQNVFQRLKPPQKIRYQRINFSIPYWGRVFKLNLLIPLLKKNKRSI